MQDTEAESLVDLPTGVTCRCGSTRATTRTQKFTDGRVHVRADCLACGAFIRFLPQTAALPIPSPEPEEAQPDERDRGMPLPVVPSCTSCGKRWAIETGIKIGAAAIALCLECSLRLLPQAIGAAVARNIRTWKPDAAKRWAAQVWKSATAAYERWLGGAT